MSSYCTARVNHDREQFILVFTLGKIKDIHGYLRWAKVKPKSMSPTSFCLKSMTSPDVPTSLRLDIL